MRKKQLALLILVGLLPAAELAAVDRLFTTASDRLILDNKRSGQSVVTEQQPLQRRSWIMLNGVVHSDKQAPRVWVNGDINEFAEDGNLELRQGSTSRRVHLRLLDRDLDISLKPGQHLDLRTGNQVEAFSVPDASSNSTSNNGDHANEKSSSSTEERVTSP